MVVRDIPNDPKAYLLKEDPINRIVDWLSKRGLAFQYLSMLLKSSARGFKTLKLSDKVIFNLLRGDSQRTGGGSL